MSEKSAIEWTDSTWTVVTGCSKVSPGCAHCYAETLTERFAGSSNTGWPARFLPWTPENAVENVVLHPERMDWPLRWRNPRRVFVTSMGDLFHELVPEAFLVDVFAVMALTQRHTFQVLTKRPDRMAEIVGDPSFRAAVAHAAWHLRDAIPTAQADWRHALQSGLPWPLTNVWLGTSVENQRWADVRIPALLRAPAAVHFLSCEPLLGPLDLDRDVGGTLWLGGQRGHDGRHNGNGGTWTDGSPCPRALHHHHDDRCERGVDWVIAGGESGAEARPMHSDWVRWLREQTRAAGVAFFFKQWGAWARGSDFRDGAMVMARDGRLVEEDAVREAFQTDDPTTLGLEYVRRVGKTSAGRDLDGRTWDEMPAVAA